MSSSADTGTRTGRVAAGEKPHRGRWRPKSYPSGARLVPACCTPDQSWLKSGTILCGIAAPGLSGGRTSMRAPAYHAFQQSAVSYDIHNEDVPESVEFRAIQG
jgi:hypothetical protein